VLRKTQFRGQIAPATIALLFPTNFHVLAGRFFGLFSSRYLPHRYCYMQQPSLVWTNVAMDGLIAASYACIFLCLFWVASRLRGIPDIRAYLWIFISFGTFIVACGATHAMEVVTVWWPVYPLSALVKVICAAASVPTAIVFARATPAIAANIRRFLEMLSTTQQEKNQALVALIASEKLAVAGRISASIAHEVKNPLESIGNILYMIENDPRVPTDLREWTRTATAELDRASGIAHNTLSLYRESSQTMPVAIGPLVEGVLHLQAAEMLKRSILVQPRIRTVSALTAYSSELQQIVINLVQNSAAAIGSEGRILVRVQPRTLLLPRTLEEQSASPENRQGLPGYSITIADTGPGIPMDARQRLFTLFFTTKGEQGTGIGLWLVRSMVEKHGGRIRFRTRTAAESRRPGTVFNVWIPSKPALLTVPNPTGIHSAA